MAPRINTFTEGRDQFQADRSQLAALGVLRPDAVAYLPDEFRHNYDLAMDAQPSLFTAPSGGVPAIFTTLIDPDVFEILFAPTKAAEIFGEQKRGSWVDDVAMFPVVEHVGEVSSYGDFNNNGHTGVNANWPARQNYIYQTVKEYGERELERAGAAKLNWVSEIDKAAATVMNRFQNLSYFFGIAGLQNYGMLNDPALSAAITPALKAYGGTRWMVNGAVLATANEIYNDIQSLFALLVRQTMGLVDQNAKMTLALSNEISVALTATNSFNVNVSDLLKKNFPNLNIVTAVQYGVTSSTNPQGISGGNLAQLYVDAVEGQDVGFLAYSEKSRSHPVVRDMSSFKQKETAGTWGAIIRFPVGIAQMLGL